MKTTLLLIAVAICGGLLCSSFQHSGPETTENGVVFSTPLNAVDSIHVDPITNSPDPFCGLTTIKYILTSDTWVRITIVCPNLRVETLVFAYQKAGIHEVVFDACSKPCGHYTAVLETYYCKEEELMTKIRSQVLPLPGSD